MSFVQQSTVNSPYSLICFISFCAFSKWTYCHSAHSPNMLNELGMAGRNLHFEHGLAYPFALREYNNYEKSMTNCPNSANIGPISKILDIFKFYP
jgi:hypothetical protein